jgi:hypothetical protein
MVFSLILGSGLPSKMAASQASMAGFSRKACSRSTDDRQHASSVDMIWPTISTSSCEHRHPAQSVTLYDRRPR